MFAEIVMAQVATSVPSAPPSTLVIPSNKTADYWMASATHSDVRIFDLATKEQIGCTIPAQATQLCRGLIAHGPLSEDIREIWIVSRWSDLPKQVPGAYYAKILARYDCKGATYRDAAVTMFDRDGEIIVGNSALGLAEPVTAGTIIDEEFRIACGLKVPEPQRRLGNINPGQLLEQMLERAESKR